MKRLWPWAILLAAFGFCVAVARPRAANPTSVPITIAVTGSTNAQLECPH